MLSVIKRRLYFVVAGYFAFWARFVLRRWQPKVVVITGSTGKTTVLHMVEAQLGEKAFYTHDANSSMGIPFVLLGLKPNVAHKWQWPIYLLRAPFGVFRKLPSQKLLVAEADTDRPGEGQFIAGLLQADFTAWVSVYRTHSMNFDRLVQSGRFESPDEAIAYDFGYFAAATKEVIAADGDQPLLVGQLKRAAQGVKIELATAKSVTGYQLTKTETVFTFSKQHIHLKGLHPKEIGISLQLVQSLLNYLGEPLDPNYTKLVMPAGRSSVFEGKHNLTLVDSTYNTGLGATTAIARLFGDYPAEHKWLVFGDILEQGKSEKEEHQKLAQVINDLKLDRVILIGPRTKKYTLPLIDKATEVVSFLSPKEVLDYLNANVKGGEAILFKGGRFLEGVIEQLLAQPSQASHLVRRSAAWVKRRQKWGLPR